MAQDFHAAFGLNGEDDTHINLTDIAGVSLAAIQELSKQMQAKDAQIAELRDEKDAQIAELKKELLAQTQAMADVKSMAAVFEARMTALEHQRGVATQAIALRTQSRAQPGATE
jgi:DNA-binding transcriptional MerR regulator